MFNPADLLIALGIMAIPLVLLIAFIFGHDNAERTRRTIEPLRLSTSWILAACAWIIFFTSPTLRTPALLIAIGMTCGALGDLVLAGVIKVPNAMIGGILVFSIGHFCHIAAFAQVADRRGYVGRGAVRQRAKGAQESQHVGSGGLHQGLSIAGDGIEIQPVRRDQRAEVFSGNEADAMPDGLQPLSQRRVRLNVAA